MTLILATSLCVSAASARTVVAVHARPDPSEAATCYRWFPLDGSVTGLERTCSGVSYVDLAIPIDTAGSKNVTVYAFRPNAQAQFSCQAYSVTKTGGYVPGIIVRLTAAPTAAFQPVVLPAINVAAGGSLWVRCTMGQNTRIMEADLTTP